MPIVRANGVGANKIVAGDSVLAGYLGIRQPVSAFVATDQDDLVRNMLTCLVELRAVPVELAFVPETDRHWIRLGDGVTLDSGVITSDGSVRLWSSAPRPRIRFNAVGTVDGDTLGLLGPSGAAAVLIDRWTGSIRVDSR